MESKRIYLREFKLKDSLDVYEWGSDERVSKLMNFETHKDYNESEKVVKSYLMKDGSLAIIKKDDEECIGSIGVIYDITHNKATLGYALKHKYWNQGYMSEVVNLIKYYLFEERYINRIEVYIYSENMGSKRVLEKCGFNQEGYLKDFYYHKGNYKDCYLFALTYDEYQGNKR